MTRLDIDKVMYPSLVLLIKTLLQVIRSFYDITAIYFVPKRR